jgi:hypothetical protein
MKEIDLSPPVGESNSKGTYKSPRKFVNACWRCGKEGNYKSECRSKSVERGKRYEDAPYIEEKKSMEGGMCT